MSSAKLVLARETEWMVPAALLTIGSAVFVLLEIPKYSGILPALLLLPMWMVAAAVMGAVLVLIKTAQMMIRGTDRPIGRWLRLASDERVLLAFVTFGMLLTGLNMIVFMCMKPLLNYLIPFWADPYLAAIDHAIFRTDPWRLLGFLNVGPLAIFYHRAWFALMIVTLLVVLTKPSSPEKSATLLTYFLLWSLFGPIVHTLLPAGGPVFYAQLGYGNRFGGLVMEQETQLAAHYLWRFYSTESFGGGAGISAMPSLHIATTAWMVIAVGQFARRWMLPMCAAAILIFLLSISLGWHYAIDGIVGAAGAYGLWKLCLALFSARSAAPQRVVQSL
jgi:hypothetical protein